MKKQRTQQESELSELKGRDIPKTVRKKNGMRLKAKHHRRLVKGLAGVAACAVLVGGAFAVNALFFNKAAPNTVEEGFVTVAYELPTDGSTPDMHSALENIGYMNSRFRAQSNYYSEMSGTVDTMLTQQVNTWKQYEDGVLIQTDITRSSMVNSARQFCYVGDRVIWREAAGGPSTYNGLDTEWKTGDPAGNMTIDDFKASRGLPGTEFSVYVINEETLLGAEEVVSNGDGTYSQTYYLDPATDKAPAYYVNQMMTTGGLTGLPAFEYITVTYTFDSTWQILASDIDESYTATMGISVGCRASYHTTYEYGTEKAESTVYEDYYSEYASKPATGTEEGSSVTAAGCLSSAFAPVLQGPATFRLGLTLDERAVEGLVYVNAADLSSMEVRAQIGALYVAYTGEDVYLRIGENFRGSLDPMQFAALFTAMTGEGDGSALDTDALLEQLGSGTFVVAEDGRSASLASVLTISGMELPVDFTFEIAEDGKTVSLGNVTTQLSLAGMQVGAELSYSQETVPEAGDPATYTDLTGMVLKLADLVTGEAIGVDLSCTLTTEFGDVVLRGNVALDFASLSVRGSLDIAYNGAQKTLDFAYQSDTTVVYLAIDGVKVRVAVSDVMEIVTGLLGESLAMPEDSVDVASLVDALLSLDLASMVSTSEEGITVAAGQLLAALGISFDLGDVTIGETENGVSVSALGADVALAPAGAFTIAAEDYADYVNAGPWLEAIASLAQAEALHADVAYEAEAFSLAASLDLDLATFSVRGEGFITWNGITKQLTFAYAQAGGDHMVYLAADGIKVKVPVSEVVGLVSGLFVADPSAPAPDADLQQIVERLFAIDVSEVFDLSEDGISLDGTELLALLGIDFALGDVQLALTESGVAVSVSGAELSLAPGEAFSVTAGDYADYVDVMPWIEAIAELASAKAWMLEFSYAAPQGDLSLAGALAFDQASESVACVMNIDFAGVRKGLSFAYGADGDIFCNFDGVRIRATASELSELLFALLGDMPQSEEGIDVQELLIKLLSSDLSDLFTVTEEGIRADGTQLLSLFGIDLSLGDVQLSPISRGVRVEAQGMTLFVVPGQPFVVESGSYTSYVDVTPLLDTAVTILRDQEIALNGRFDVVYGDLAFNLAVEEGWLSWKDGIALCADLRLTAGETVVSVSVDATADRFRIVFGTLAVELSYGELDELKVAFADVYARIAQIVNRSAADGSFLPAQAEEIGLQLGAGAAVTDLFSSFDLQSLWKELSLGGASDAEGSIATVAFGSALFDVCLARQGVTLHASGVSFGGISLSGMLGVSVSDGRAAEVQREYLTVRDLCELVDFVGAAVGSLASPDLSITFRDGVTVNMADGKNKFTIDGKLVYHSGLSGAGFPIVVDTQGKTVTVDPEAYLYFNLQLDEKSDSGTDLNFEFWMLDSNGDHELEFFVSLSKFLTGTSDPLRFAVSASDVMTLLSGGLSLVGGEDSVLETFLVGMGVPKDTVAALFTVLDEYLVDKWLAPDEAGQFAAVGDMLMNTLGIREKLETMLDGVSDTVSGALEDVDLGSVAVDPAAYLKEFGLSYGDNGEVQFTLQLNSDLVFGGEGMQPLTITMSKAERGGESYLTAIALSNIYGNNNAERTSIPFSFDYAALTLANDGSTASVTQSGEQIASITFADYQNYTFAGVDDLLKSLALSATHKTQDGYALNDSFYISGSASLELDLGNLLGFDSMGLYTIDGITIDLAVSLDENGEIALDAKINYPGVQELNQVVINGDTQLEITIEDGLVYLKRTQYTYWKTTIIWTTEETYGTPVVTYRVMPLASFFGGFLGQIAYLFNLSDEIAELIPTESSSSEPTTEDYGVVLYNYLKSYSYAAKADGTGGDWVLTMNGDYLTDGVLSDIGITFGSGQYNRTNNVLRTLDVDTYLVKVLHLMANLTFRNPMNEWEDGYSDLTNDIAAEFANADFASIDWSAQAKGYVVPEPRTIRYTLEGEEIGEQTVWYDAETGAALSQLQYPDLSAYEREGYTLTWNDSIGADGTIEATYTPKLYDVTFVSPERLGDDWTLQADGSFALTMQMYYDAEVELRWGDGSHTFTVGSGSNVFDLGAVIGDARVLWNETELDLLANGATILIPLTPDTVIYTSNGVSFTLGEATNVTSAEVTFDMSYTLETPVAQGYTFLGWFVQEDGEYRYVTEFAYTGGGTSTTVSALWVSNVTVSASGSRTSSGWLIKTYHHSANVNVSGGTLAGAPKESVATAGIRTDYTLTLPGSGWFQSDEVRTGSTDQLSFSQTIDLSQDRSVMHVDVTVTYTYRVVAANGTETDISCKVTANRATIYY